MTFVKNGFKKTGKTTVWLSWIAILLWSGFLNAQEPAVDPYSLSANPRGSSTAQTPPKDQRKINVILVGYDIENNQAAQDMLNEMAKAAQDSGAIGKVILAGKDDERELQQAMNQAVNVATGGNIGAVSGGGAPADSSSDPILLILFFLILAVLLVGITFLLIRRRREVGPALVQAGLKISHPDGTSDHFSISQILTTIGRDPKNLLVLNDSRISLFHAEISATPDGFLIRDLGSSNGTTINGERITQARLYEKDKIVLGSTRMVFVS